MNPLKIGEERIEHLEAAIRAALDELWIGDTGDAEIILRNAIAESP